MADSQAKTSLWTLTEKEKLKSFIVQGVLFGHIDLKSHFPNRSRSSVQVQYSRMIKKLGLANPVNPKRWTVHQEELMVHLAKNGAVLQTVLSHPDFSNKSQEAIVGKFRRLSKKNAIVSPKFWSKTEIEQLVRLVSTGCNVDQIMTYSIFKNRSMRGIQTKYFRLIKQFDLDQMEHRPRLKQYTYPGYVKETLAEVKSYNDNRRSLGLRGLKVKAHLESLPRFTTFQTSIIYGTLLGDASSRTGGKNCHLSFEQGPHRAAYVNHLYENFELCTGMSPYKQVRYNNFHVLYGVSLRFTTYSFEEISLIAKKFYKWDDSMSKWKKSVPRDIEQYLNPVSLAYWSMDDLGTDRSNCTFYTNNFTIVDCGLLVKALRNKFQIDCDVKMVSRKKPIKKREPVIVLTADGSRRLSQIIAPYILPIFRYKLV